MKSFSQAVKEEPLSPRYAHLAQQPSIVNRFFKKLFELYCKVLFRFWCPVKVTGRENIPTSSSFILSSNHCSHMDTGVLMIAAGLPFKRYGMMAAEDYFFDNSPRRLFFNLLMTLIPIDRDAGYQTMVNMLVACREFTKPGDRCLIMYPEGTRSLTGEMQDFKKGIGVLATELNLPIVPAHIRGTFKVMPKGSFFMKPNGITVQIGQPILPNDYLNNVNGKSNWPVYRQVSRDLKKRIKSLRNP